MHGDDKEYREDARSKQIAPLASRILVSLPSRRCRYARNWFLGNWKACLKSKGLVADLLLMYGCLFISITNTEEYNSTAQAPVLSAVCAIINFGEVGIHLALLLCQVQIILGHRTNCSVRERQEINPRYKLVLEGDESQQMYTTRCDSRQKRSSSDSRESKETRPMVS